MSNETEIITSEYPINGISTCMIQYTMPSINEHKNEKGLTHLWEHLKCSSISSKTLQKLQRLGINWNSYTGNKGVYTYFYGLTDNLFTALDYLLGKSQKHNIIKYNNFEEHFDREKKTVINEYNENYLTNKNLLHKMINEYYYNNYESLGNLQVLKDVTIEKFNNFKEHKELQFPSKIVFLTDPSRYGQCEKLCQYSGLQKQQNNNKLSGIRLYKFRSLKKPVEIGLNKSDISLSYICGVSPLSPLSCSGSMIVFIASLLGNGLCSPLYRVLREKLGLTYGVNCGKLNYLCNALFVSTIVDGSKTMKASDEILKILSNPEKFITKDNFKQVLDMNLSACKLNSLNKADIYNTEDDLSVEKLDYIEHSVGYDGVLNIIREAAKSYRLTYNLNDKMILT